MNRRVLVLGISFIGVLFIAWSVAWLWVDAEIPRNTRVLGVEIGAQSRSEAVQRLRQATALQANAPIQLEADGKVHKISPVTLGASLDVEATIWAASARTFNPIQLFKHAFSTVVVTPVILVNGDRFTHAIDDLALKNDVPVQEGDVIFKGVTPIATLPIDGIAIDKKRALAAFKAQWLRSTPIRIPSNRQAARITGEEIQRVIRDLARPAVAEPLTLAIDGHECIISQASIAASLSFQPDGLGHLVPRFSSAALADSLGSVWLRLVRPATDASFKLINGKPHIYPSSVGRKITDDALTEALTSVLSLSGAARQAAVSTTIEQPRITTADVSGLGISSKIVSFSTRFPPAAYRIQNIHRAADLIDGTILKPGDIFSLNRTVGERTAANGFAEGIVIYNGRFEKDFGGGVSQVATTIWNAAWFAGLELIAHMPHSFYISRYPAGRESTVAWPNVDVQFRNNTDRPLLINTSYTNRSIAVSIYGTRKYEVETVTGPRLNLIPFKVLDDDSPTCIQQGGVPGFDIDVTRTLKLEDTTVKREVFHTHYDPEDRVSCTNPDAVFGNGSARPRAKPNVTPTATPSVTPTATPSVTPTAIPTS